MEEKFIKPMAHQAEKPLQIERDWSSGREVIIIEGVRYAAEFFQMIAKPEIDALYALKNNEIGNYWQIIRSMDEAKKFFEETPIPTFPQIGEERPDLGEGEKNVV